ncbi:DNA cytosine methyltransferase [Cryobacterium sp. PH31-L1]|uniref:DNA cytosine methyltransferase n=1 Tax=Cryobacterium sp. PH31-L1 TaxID=3046199 RepID=UPI0024B90A9F|nr:DNA cytosine methyltransferase [Cryobacterium sp. PH31-L1]MDJ0376440.1 DNA cytosine methyltransferase [Cryobacterium sp. PH31-L1]
MRAVDLFAGCGGLSRGFADAGVDVVAAFENWDPAIATYRQNFDHPIFKMDLSDVEGVSSLLKSDFAPDMIIGGPPCQDFSSAGKRIEQGRADLTVAFSQIVSKVRPAYFVMENVERARGSAAYQDARANFKEAGYGLIETVLDASFYGAPQKRKRFFCIGRLGAEDSFVSVPPEALASTKPMTVRDYFGESFGGDHYYRHPRNYSRRAVFSIDEPAPTMRGVNRPIPGGYPGHSGDSHELDGSVMAITTEQRARIQTFPSSFIWEGPKTHVEQLIGNAVPVKLAEFIGRYVMDHARSQHENSLDEFLVWLEARSADGHSRSLNDVVSRVRRANQLQPFPEYPDLQYLVDLAAGVGFQELVPAVRSQLRRAAKLYVEFMTPIPSGGESKLSRPATPESKNVVV